MSSGHFVEGSGEHYVCLTDDRQETSATDGLNVSHSLMDEEKANEAEVPHRNRESEKEDGYGEDFSDKKCETRVYEKEDGTESNDALEDEEQDCVPYLNPDILEKVIKTTLQTCPQMRQTPRAVSRFFQRAVDSVPFPQIYIPELKDFANIRHVSLRRIIKMKGKNRGVLIALRQLINSSNWENALISLVACGLETLAVSNLLEKALIRLP